MGFLDSFYGYRSTEPIWFRYFRGFFIVIFTALIIYNSYSQLQKVGIEATNIIKDKSSTASSFIIKMCTGISNNMTIVNQPSYLQTNEYTTYCQRIYLNYDYNLFWDLGFSDYFDYLNNLQPDTFSITFNPNNNSNENINIPSNFTYPYSPLSIPNNLLLINFDSFTFSFEGDNNEFEITNNLTYIKEFQSYIMLGRNHFTIYLGQAFLIFLNPIFTCEKIRDDYLANTIQVCKLELNSQLEQIPVQLEPNEIHIGIYPRSDPQIIRFEISQTFSLTDAISNLGGFYGGIMGIFIFLFGMQKLEPWGVVQKYLFSFPSCMHNNESLKRNFAKKYVSSAGIPLVEKVNERPEGSSIDDRVQILENLLKEYYLDDYFLEKVKEVITNHEIYKKKYDKIHNSDDTDNDGDTYDVDI
ncbi:hypothetical protein C1645_819747 [Glomus cerebriforme]|uniref:Transmembrane protein n=1 Tax=Glomus cerebriforme TaxID=658196 RepID=A0A397T7C1_9GLOM|nr:hypothetical protein C1645_819747 [Glomus cerebriforme]